MGKTRDRTVRDIYVTDPRQISVRMDRLQRAVIRDGWRLIFSLKTYVFAEIRECTCVDVMYFVPICTSACHMEKQDL